jgi:hypothetical protein
VYNEAEERENVERDYKKSMARTGLTWAIINAVLTGVLFGVTGQHIYESRDCNWHMFMWPLVLGAFHFFLLLCSLIYICAAMRPYPQVKKTKGCLDFLACSILFNFWVAWMVWGNIIIYKKAWHCRHDVDALPVFRLVLGFVVIGYIGWALYLCLACNLMLGMLGKMAGRKGKEKALDMYNIYGGRQASSMKAPDRCVICGDKYLSNDDLVQLRCGDNHIFHTNCLVRQIERDPSCPVCRTGIQGHRGQI